MGADVSVISKSLRALQDLQEIVQGQARTPKLPSQTLNYVSAPWSSLGEAYKLAYTMGQILSFLQRPQTHLNSEYTQS